VLQVLLLHKGSHHLLLLLLYGNPLLLLPLLLLWHHLQALSYHNRGGLLWCCQQLPLGGCKRLCRDRRREQQRVWQCLARRVGRQLLQVCLEGRLLLPGGMGPCHLLRHRRCVLWMTRKAPLLLLLLLLLSQPHALCLLLTRGCSWRHLQQLLMALLLLLLLLLQRKHGDAHSTGLLLRHSCGTEVLPCGWHSCSCHALVELLQRQVPCCRLQPCRRSYDWWPLLLLLPWWLLRYHVLLLL
jgi:hypothetical protein